MGSMLQSSPSPLRGGIKGGGSAPFARSGASRAAGTPTLTPSPQGVGKPALWLSTSGDKLQ
jgi:hypothetical protein